MLATLTESEATRLDEAAARLGVSADDIATAVVVSFLAGRDTPSQTSRRSVLRHTNRRAKSFLKGRDTPSR